MAEPRVASATRLAAALSLVAAALTLVVIVASATMRHAQSGVGCTPWPDCYASSGGVPDATGVGTARRIHRAAATAAAMTVLVLAALAWRRPDDGLRTGATAALGLVAGLAALGLLTPGSRWPAIALANLVGGHALLATLVATAVPRAAPLSRSASRLAIVSLAMVATQVLAGGLIATQSALLACPGFPGCDGAAIETAGAGAAWNPWREPAVSAGRIVPPPGAALLHVVHRANAIAVAALVLALAARLRHDRFDLATAMLVALVTTAAAGIAAASVPSSLPVAVVHGASAALLAALVARSAASPVARRVAASAQRTSMRGT